MQLAAAAMTVLFVGVAASAVLMDRTIEAAPRPTLPPMAEPAGTASGDDDFEPFPPLIASGLSSVYALDDIEVKEGGTDPEGPETPQAQPQDIVLVASIGRPGSMMAVIREGAAQTAIAQGQRAGSVDVLEVRPGWARVRHRGVEKELTVGEPTLLVSDMGAGAGQPMSSQVIGSPDATGMVETLEERGVTQTRAPTRFQRAQQGGNNPGGGSRRSSGGTAGAGNQGNQGNQAGGGTRPRAGNQANGTGGQGAEDDR